MGIVADSLQVAGSAGPWLALGLVVAVAGARFANGLRKAARESARAQGARIGELERVADSERTRRRQVEATLIRLGVDLPWWPPDGPQAPRWRPADDDEDLADEQPVTEARRIPVPPLPHDIGARHSRRAAGL